MCANPIVMFTIRHVLVHYCMTCKGGHNDNDSNVNFTFILRSLTVKYPYHLVLARFALAEQRQYIFSALNSVPTI